MNTFVVIGSGPSLTQEDVDACRGRARVIAVNDCYHMAPWADYLYARDYSWWANGDGPSRPLPNYVEARVKMKIGSQCWSGDEKASREFGLRYIATRSALGLCPITGIIHDGGPFGANSGYQAINLAIQFGAKRVLLLGFDMGATGKGHFFGAHPAPLVNVEAIEYPMFAKVFESMVPDLQSMQIEVVNCTRKSALTCFRMSTIQRELGIESDLPRSAKSGCVPVSLQEVSS